jgi:hypothetical protein
VIRSPSGAAALAAVTRYLLEVNEIAAPVLLDVPESALEPEALEAVMTGAERLREEGREQGRAEGRAAIILKVLAKRFAPLSAETIARVQTSSPDELDRIAERLLSATSLDELFG